ncbi:MAG: hypothetical protein AAFY88_20660, partial [Acidobacteriota bacterium]
MGRFDEVEAAAKTARRKLADDVDGGLVGDLLGDRGDSLRRGDLRAFELAADAGRGRGRGVTNAPASQRRRAVLELAAARLYGEAAGVAAGIGGLEGLAGLLGGVGQFEEQSLHPEDPTTPIRALVRVLRFDQPPPEKIAEWLRQGFGPLEVEALFNDLEGRLPKDLEGVPLPPAARADLALAGLGLTVNGAPHLGYRVTVAGSGDAPSSRSFVTLRGEDLRLAGLGGRRSTLGFEALKRLGDGDLPGAQQWLDWARVESPETPGVAGDAFGFDPFDRLWPAEPPEERQPVNVVRRAAAALAAPSSGDALAILQEAESRGGGTPEIAAAIDVALLEAFVSAGDFLGLDAHSGVLLERQPASTRAFAKRLEALAALEQWAALETAARERVEAGYVDADSRRVLAGIAVDRSQPKEAADLMRRVADQGEIKASDAANLLLLMLLEDPAPWPEAQALIERTRDDGERSARWWRAVAAWHLERGRIRDGRSALARSVAIGGGGLQLPDAYVVGRLATLCGMPETAEALHRRLESEAGAALRAP